MPMLLLSHLFLYDFDLVLGLLPSYVLYGHRFKLFDESFLIMKAYNTVVKSDLDMASQILDYSQVPNHPS